MHSLNVKLTYQCSNHCEFCFSTYLQKEKIGLDEIKKSIIEGAQNGCQALVISGGEPTLFPSHIIEIIDLAESIGFKHYTIQTNGIGLSCKKKLLKYLSQLSKNKDVFISFSVHGSNSDIHDQLSSQSGAFSKTLAAIENIYQFTDCKIMTNTVISKDNYFDLLNIYFLLAPFKPIVTQFSILHTDNNNLSVGLIESSILVKELATIIPKEILRTEGIPYCLMRGIEKCVGESYWPERLDLFNKKDDYISDFNQLDVGMRYKASFCKQCIMNNICSGTWLENKNELLENCKPIC